MNRNAISAIAEILSAVVVVASLIYAGKEGLLLFERHAIMLWHHNYQLRMQGLLPDANWFNQNWIIQDIGQRQSLRAARNPFKVSHETTFQDIDSATEQVQCPLGHRVAGVRHAANRPSSRHHFGLDEFTHSLTLKNL